jgi:hypothetical protein
MSKFAMDYRQLDNDELPQLWVERFQPVGEAKVGAAEASDLAPAVETFINVSAFWWLIRELWLRNQRQSGVSAPWAFLLSLWFRLD